ncbi:family domain-containing protein [Cyclospora cayetanensis]|uniref:Family domain-containing protein n=1 Tax=Cyclospora cayetanensis TaxID=88456 RepID=A0A1D3D4J7_9EIME|nr:family domain-containing protein [Cyclospora cayetanensis]
MLLLWLSSLTPVAVQQSLNSPFRAEYAHESSEEAARLDFRNTAFCIITLQEKRHYTARRAAAKAQSQVLHPRKPAGIADSSPAAQEPPHGALIFHRLVFRSCGYSCIQERKMYGLSVRRAVAATQPRKSSARALHVAAVSAFPERLHGRLLTTSASPATPQNGNRRQSASLSWGPLGLTAAAHLDTIQRVAAPRFLSSSASPVMESIPVEETPNPNALKFRPLLPRPLVNAKGSFASRNFTKTSPGTILAPPPLLLESALLLSSPVPPSAALPLVKGASGVCLILTGRQPTTARKKNHKITTFSAHFPSGFSGVADSPMAQAILQERGVVSVLLGAGFVSVVKEAEAQWEDLKPREHAHEASSAAEAPMGPEEEELFESIKETLNCRVRPMLQGDGGDLEVLRFDSETGQLYVHLLGSCQGCPSSTVTVKRGMEQMLKYYYPEASGLHPALCSVARSVISCRLSTARTLARGVEAVVECDENGEPLQPEDEEAE